MNAAKLDFQRLNVSTAGGSSWCSTFAYWLGVLTDPQANFARQVEQTCSTMAGYYNSEEQACDETHLHWPSCVPIPFQPIAPVTLALQWSPFPAAATALGDPIHLDCGPYTKTLAVFLPVDSPSFQATMPDERHFLFLLRHCCQRAQATRRWVMLAGCVGWSYNSEDCIAEDRDLRRIMKKFGFVYYGRKPKSA